MIAARWKAGRRMEPRFSYLDIAGSFRRWPGEDWLLATGRMVEACDLRDLQRAILADGWIAFNARTDRFAPTHQCSSPRCNRPVWRANRTGSSPAATARRPVGRQTRGSWTSRSAIGTVIPACGHNASILRRSDRSEARRTFSDTFTAKACRGRICTLARRKLPSRATRSCSQSWRTRRQRLDDEPSQIVQAPIFRTTSGTR